MPPPAAPTSTDAATRLRLGLAGALAGLGGGGWPLQQGPAGDLDERGVGHFHLVPELFVLLAGLTCFRFPQGAQLGCHLALETAPGRPGIAHLELRSDTCADAVQGWLAAAAQLGPEAGGQAPLGSGPGARPGLRGPGRRAAVAERGHTTRPGRAAAGGLPAGAGAEPAGRPATGRAQPGGAVGLHTRPPVACVPALHR